jgi:hypothetical protein
MAAPVSPAKRLALTAGAVARLGFDNAARVAAHRVLKRVGAYARAPAPPLSLGPFGFRDAILSPSPMADDWRRAAILEGEDVLEGRVRMLGAPARSVGSPPDWRANQLGGPPRLGDQHWSQYSDAAGHGDIKGVWELSRGDWALSLARAARASGERRFTDTLESWLSDWVKHNPTHAGPNWMCAQETAIRMMQVLLAARIVNAPRTPAFTAFVRAHVARIAATPHYSIAQQNNHATSEAAGLFIGGLWLADEANAQRGRALLERLAAGLILPDGSFAQHSVTYHRLALDTLVFCELWRRQASAPAFSPRFRARMGAAAQWLAALIDPLSGDAPNLGPNDGAYVLRLTSLPYRDFRPSAELAWRVAFGARLFGAGAWDEPAMWHGLTAPSDQRAVLRGPRWFADAGYALIGGETVGADWAMIRAPQARFRPGHCDALHFDLWAKGVNIIRDAGTSSYALDDAAARDFSGAPGHSTVEVDDRDPMPRLSRFLYGAWIKVDAKAVTQSAHAQSWRGAYQDWQKARVGRTVTRAEPGQWRIEDTVDGAQSHWIVRFRLADSDWRLDGTICASALARFTIDATGAALRLTRLPESLWYGERHETPALEIRLPASAGACVTRIEVL